MNLRAYQTRAIADLRSEYARGRRAPVLVLPTGAGKTVVAAEVIRSAVARGRRVLFLAHRVELVSQSVAKLESAGVTDLRIIQAAADLGSRSAPVAVASIPTLTKWDDRMPDADLVIFDECHHTVARTWSRIAERYSAALLLGLTATPQRGDGRALGDIFDSMVVGSTVAELTALGHLVPCRAWSAADSLRYGQMAVSPVQAYRDRGNGPAVVFCANVEHATRVADEFNAAGIGAAMVEGSMASQARRDALSAFATGRLTVVTNVHVLTEGWDCPSAATCILARKPQHDGTFLQMVGRVLRPAPGKTHATLIDLCGSVLDHGVPEQPREFSLEGKGITAKRDAIRQCVACGGVFLAGPTACPMCGFTAPAREIRLPVEIGGELVDLSTLPRLPPRAFTVAIVAKYPGRCRVCSGPIAAGESIYWAKGEKARHAECPRRTAATIF